MKENTMAAKVFAGLVVLTLWAGVAGQSKTDSRAIRQSSNTAPLPVTLYAYPTHLTRLVDVRMFGINAAVWDANFTTTSTHNLLGSAGVGVMRFPGGSLADDYHWATNTTDSNIWHWATSFDSFAKVIKAGGIKGLITTNYGTGTPQEAALWVKHSNVDRTYGIKWWELGNECYGTWETDAHAVPHDPYTYANAYVQYRKAMRAQDPTIKLGIVIVPGEDSYANNTNHPAMNPLTLKVHNGWTPVMLATLRSQNVIPDFVVYHYYPEGPGTETDAGLLKASSNWATDIPNIRSMLSTYIGATAARNVEILMTENNSVYSNPGKQTTSVVNALYLADSFAQAAQTELKGFFWWNLRNGTEAGNNNSASLYGWRTYGDYGMIGPADDRYPSFFAFRALKFFARAGDYTAKATSSNSAALSFYCSKHPDGSISLLAINKTLTPAAGTVVLSSFVPNAQATVHSYGIPQDNAAMLGTGSVDVGSTVLSVGPKFSYTFAPYSITVITVTPASGP